MLEKVARQGGPFAGIDKAGQYGDLVDTAMGVSTEGFPRGKQRWGNPNGVHVSEYVPFLKEVFTRTVPTPISN